jgi:NAD(P)-dependent dehydrogenase (short-subunit alcohol dehydrogenase family)
MTHPLFDLTGRVALVSGAASGMGRATALGLAEVGADLLLCDINKDGMKKTAAEIEKLGRRAVSVVCDVSEIDQIDAMFETLDAEYGRIDVLCNIAGEGVRADPLTITQQQFLHALQGLLLGRFHIIQHAGKRMLLQGKGSIMSIVSIGGINSLGRHHFAYGVAMAAGAQMTRELSTEWAGRGVRVNSIVCAQIENQGLRERMAEDPNLRDAFLRGLPIGRLGKPDEIKGLAIFLASDASSFITGSMIPLDGGNLAKNAGGSHPGMPGETSA